MCWIQSPWVIYKEMAMDKISKLIKDTKAFLRGTEAHEELMRRTNEVLARPRPPTNVEQAAVAHAIGLFVIPISSLRPDKEEPGVLRGTININGVNFHVEAIEVEYVDHVQNGVTLEAQSFLEDLPYRDGPFDTVEYKGKEYVLHIFPFSR